MWGEFVVTIVVGARIVPIGLVGGIKPYQYSPNIFEWVDPLGLVKDTIAAIKSVMTSDELKRTTYGVVKLVLPYGRKKTWSVLLGCVAMLHLELERFLG